MSNKNFDIPSKLVKRIKFNLQVNLQYAMHVTIVKTLVYYIR